MEVLYITIVILILFFAIAVPMFMYLDGYWHTHQWKELTNHTVNETWKRPDGSTYNQHRVVTVHQCEICKKLKKSEISI